MSEHLRERASAIALRVFERLQLSQVSAAETFAAIVDTIESGLESDTMRELESLSERVNAHAETAAQRQLHRLVAELERLDSYDQPFFLHLDFHKLQRFQDPEGTRVDFARHDGTGESIANALIRLAGLEDGNG